MPTDPNNERYTHNFSEGENGWGEGTAQKDGYQDIIDALESDVPVVDSEANIQQYRPLPGRRFVAEDTEREYIGDGSAWVQVTSRGPNPEFESVRSGELSVRGTERFASGDYEIITEGGLYGSSRYSTTATSYGGSVARSHGRWSADMFPTDTTPKIRLICRLVNDTAGETTFARAEVGGSGIAATELSVAGTSIQMVDSGWVDVPTDSGIHRFSGVQMKVSGGSGEMLESPILFVAGEYQ